MKENSVLRLAFIIGDGQSKSFELSLYKLISMVLYDNKNDFLTTFQLCETIESDYELVFTEEEILHVINNDKFSKNFNVLNDKGIKKYSLSMEKYHSLKNRESNYNLEKYVSEYIKEQNLTVEKQYLTKLITDFMYRTFSVNKKVVLDLLNKSYDSVVEQTNIPNDEKRLINGFLNWENSEKNKFIFNTISYCVDYCQLTIKKDSNTFNSIFGGKKFYLDSNVILRLIGFNNQERKKVMSAFVERCKQSRIDMLFTNFTYDEVITTINQYVEGLSKDNRGLRPLKYENYERFLPNERNLDFFKIYLDWSKQPGNNYSNYEAFRKYLVSQVNEVLSKFKKVDYVDYYTQDKERYLTYYDQLRDYKEKNSRQFTSASIKVDVNNFMFMCSIRERENGSTMFNINNYFISTDSRLCSWSSELIPGGVPICVLPSVWYSLILKFKGRTDDDYSAFCLFLNMRYKIEDNQIDIKKSEILAIVQNLDEPTYIKDKILENIYNEIVNTGSISIDNPSEIVEREQNETIQKELERIRKTEGNPYIKQGELKTIDRLAEINAETKHKWFGIIQKFVNIVKIIIGLVFAGCLIWLIAKNRFVDVINYFAGISPGLDITHWICIGTFIWSIVNFFVVSPILKQLNEMTIDKLMDKEKKKLIKKFSKASK